MEPCAWIHKSRIPTLKHIARIIKSLPQIMQCITYIACKNSDQSLQCIFSVINNWQIPKKTILFITSSWLHRNQVWHWDNISYKAFIFRLHVIWSKFVDTMSLQWAGLADISYTLFQPSRNRYTPLRHSKHVKISWLETLDVQYGWEVWSMLTIMQLATSWLHELVT